MGEFNLLDDYPQPNSPRVVAPNLRTIQHRIIASRRDKNFFDGDRNTGYGGYRYDGRWVPVAKKIISHYKIPQNGSILHVSCEKGFLLHDMRGSAQSLNVFGTETSDYAIENAMDDIRNHVQKAPPTDLPFADRKFDFVIGLGVVYIHTLADAIKVLQEIQRVGKGKAFITLATYETEEEYFLFRDWTLLGALIFRKSEWEDVMKLAGYTGDYYFTGAKSLKLIRNN
jgi:SAM-dependent methyltransferase